MRVIRKIFKSFLENRVLSRWAVLTIDILIIFVSTIISYSISLQIYKNLKVQNHPELDVFLGVTLFFNLLFFLVFKTYKGIIRYSTIHELQRILLSLLLADSFVFFFFYKIIGPSGSVAVAYSSTVFLVSLVALYGFRIIVVYSYQRLVQSFGSHPPIPVLIWGVNEESLALSQMSVSGRKYQIKGFIEHRANTKFKNQTNLPILYVDNPKDLLKYNIAGVLFIDDKTIKADISFVEVLIGMGVHVCVSQQKNINSVSQLSDAMNQIRPIQIEDLLGREEINISLDVIGDNVKGKTILVTGAAGSIGSEIVRQLATFEPQSIICFDQAETPLNELNIEMDKKYPNLKLISVMGNICNINRISNVFKTYKPHIVYHAAAYKHVPMMEKDPSEAIITNVLGSKNLVDLSIQHSVEMFVMISTDKAVNPTNIMGASKRIAEIYVQSSAIDANKNTSKTKFVTTRFGNVLGSNGSVIPLFRKQIEGGGPITVTHPDITRYFMTIPEACRLVLEASIIGKSGHIYVFDMGESVKILDLAVRMIELAGLIPYEDIDIEFSGLRSGEKLYEELLSNSEISIPTSHKKVMVAKVREYVFDEVASSIQQIISYAQEEDRYKMVASMKNLVPEFLSKNSEFESLDKKTN
ncbi:MAG: hypothetical protein RL662_2031 [Bacteroidota bacterium]|jgi:FlaA1/EpsC-like NDP-sugar epimerase